MFKRKLTIIISLLLLTVSVPVLAQSDRQALTITPPLIKNNVSPGQLWKSYVKVVNNNDTEVKVYHEVKDFRGGTESGTVDFLEDNSEDLYLLSNWIKIEEESVVIPPFESVELPFIVVVPEDASPGGHYAAILLGTKPVKKDTEGAVMKVSSMLASLILLNVGGEVEESGRIREFSTNKTVFTEPEVFFDVRFENTGNVHVQPQGEIRIYDWFGNDKGVMSINHGTSFGNVLPKTIRKWNFTWEGGNNLFEMGRYKASLILGFGDETRQTISRDMYFWIINVKILLYTITPILFFMIMMVLIIRSYIKRAIAKTREEFGIVEDVEHEKSVRDATPTEMKRRVWPKFILVVIIATLLIGGIFSIVFYVNTKNNEFRERYENNNKETINPDSIEIGKLTKKEDPEETINSTKVPIQITENKEKDDDIPVHDGPFEVTVLNGSGKAGVAKHVADKLKDAYSIGDIGNAEAYEYSYTFIRYKRGLKEEAVELKKFFDEDTEIQEDNEMMEEVVVVVGKEFTIN